MKTILIFDNRNKNKTKMKNQNQNPETTNLIGMYVNRVLFSDVDPIGKIVELKGKYKAILKVVVASENKTKMDFVSGGFSAVCLNNYSQEYDFFETEEFIEISLSETNMKKKFLRIHNAPRKHYDYNF